MERHSLLPHRNAGNSVLQDFTWFTVIVQVNGSIGLPWTRIQYITCTRILWPLFSCNKTQHIMDVCRWCFMKLAPNLQNPEGRTMLYSYYSFFSSTCVVLCLSLFIFPIYYVSLVLYLHFNMNKLVSWIKSASLCLSSISNWKIDRVRLTKKTPVIRFANVMLYWLRKLLVLVKM